ncbi:MAG: 16S rRNA (cytosine(1402)-N(4))-methyltransferase RsmH [Nitrospirota bacterium]
MAAIHHPVMVHEVVQWLACAPGRRMADLTVGLGGHAAAILDACAPDGLLVGLDRDEDALAIARTRLPADRARLHHADARALPDVLAREGWERVDGVLLDLGVSSLQLDTPERGFSFQADGPLDMRMNRRNPLTAAVIVNEWDEDALADLLREYGEERWAGRIAAAIARARDVRPLTGTKDLADLVVGALPAKFRAPHPHPATRTFQALRIAVNRELEDLAPTLEAARGCLTVGGRLVVLSFHSLEDRIVKQTFRRWEGACVCPPGLPVCGCGRVRRARVLTARPVVADPDEIERNPRARSAKLRAVERAAA